MSLRSRGPSNHTRCSPKGATLGLTLLGLQRARGCDRIPPGTSLGNTGVPCPLGPHNSLTSLYSLRLCLSQYQAAKGSRFLHLLPQSQLLGKVKILGWDRTGTKWPGDSEITFSPETEKKNCLSMLSNASGDNKVHTGLGHPLPSSISACNLGKSWPPGPPLQGELHPAAALAQGIFSLAQLLFLRPPRYEPLLP